MGPELRIRDYDNFTEQRKYQAVQVNKEMRVNQR
jgi:hypothetical protein